MPAWVEAGYQEYAKRLPRDVKVELQELPLGQRSKNNPDIARAIAQEGERMLGAIPQGDRVVALEVQGKNWSTEQLAERMRDWQMQGDNCTLLIGGPDGLARNCVARANEKWSLSGLTLPHPLVRIVLIEQLYRASTILSGHPYHK